MTKVDQTIFRQALLDPELECPDGLIGAQGDTAGRRFDVYRNNVATSLIDALETAFPVVRKLVGEANFKVLAARFYRQHPPNSPLMMFYGGEMPSFLAEFGPTAATGYLPDIARLELALRESYHGCDATPIDPSILQALPPERLMTSQIFLAPSLRLIQSQWPVHAIWTFNTTQGAPKPQMMPQDVLIVRPEFDPKPLLLPSGGGAFVASLLAKANFGSALEAVGDPDFDLSAVLSILIADSQIIDIKE